MKALKGFAKFCKGVADQLAAIYDPRLVAISDHGIIIDWVDERTGEKPWFS